MMSETRANHLPYFSVVVVVASAAVVVHVAVAVVPVRQTVSQCDRKRILWELFSVQNQ